MNKVVVCWTLGEIRSLRKLTAGGMSGRDISKSLLIPRHTRPAIEAKMHQLGLGQAKFRERGVKARRTSAEKRAAIVAFLKGEGLWLTSYEAGLKLGISQEMVAYYRRKLKIRLPNSIRFSSPKFLQAHKHVLESMNRGLRNRRARFWNDRRTQLYHQLVKDSQYRAIKGFAECLTCREKWPATEAYFYRGRKDKATGKRNLLPHCRCCGRNVWKNKLKKSA